MDGKFFRRNQAKSFVRRVTYGPFEPREGPDGFGFPAPDQTAQDFARIRELEANLIRVYDVPPGWFLDLAASQQLQVLIDIPWSKHVGLLDSVELRNQGRAPVPQAVGACARHSAVLAFSAADKVAELMLEAVGRPVGQGKLSTGRIGRRI